jgi:hypothetical protein
MHASINPRRMLRRAVFRCLASELRRPSGATLTGRRSTGSAALHVQLHAMAQSGAKCRPPASLQVADWHRTTYPRNRPLDERMVSVGRCITDTDRTGPSAVPGKLGQVRKSPT